jgi:outer membrane protein OmpA-like peptidoglycan-associated protein
VSGPTLGTMKMLGKIRYILLAATLLSTLALPQWTRASDTRGASGAIILAQAPNPNDPKEKDKAKAKQQPQQRGTPQITTPQPKAPAQVVVPQPNAPAQVVVPQPKAPAQPKIITTTPSTGTPPGPPGSFRGTPPTNRQGIGQQQTLPQGQPKVGTANNPPATGTPPNGPALRTIPPGGQPSGQQPAPKGPQFGRQTPATPPGPPPQGGPQAVRQAPLVQPPRYGNVEQLRSLRQERVEGNQRVFVEPGNRFIVREGNRTFVRHDEGERFRRWDANARLERRGGESFTYFRRPGGYEIIDVTDANGRLLRRIRRGPDGREIVLIDNRMRGGSTSFFLALAPPVISMPRERYIVDVDGAPPALLYETLEADPVAPIDRAYSLDEIRYNAPLRDRLTRLDLNTITFETGSWEVSPDQADKLGEVAAVIQRILQRRPNEIFLIEGHTDAVGNDVDNLSLSDRRAESVAGVLTENFQIPPENLTTQGYGSQFLKIPTQGPSRENRRVAVRRITPLLMGAAR